MRITFKGSMLESLIKLGEIGVGALVGFLFNRATRGDTSVPPGMEWVVGGMVSLLLMMIDLMFRFALASDRQREELAALAGTLSEEASDQALLQRALAYGGRSLSADDADIAWRELTWLTRRMYCATNYIDPGTFYDNGHAENVVQLQKIKVSALPRFTLKKVMIWKDVTEKGSEVAQKVLRMHQDPAIPMQIKGILRDEITKSQPLRECLQEKLENRLDFAIFDEMVVLIWHLDRNRKITSAEVLAGIEAARPFQHFFDTLHTHARI